MNTTKSKITSAAIKIFGSKPSASMEEIAESINLSRRTLHRHFNSKSELITEIIDHASTLCLHNTKEVIQSSADPTNQLNAMFLSDIKSGYQFRFLYNYKDSFKGMEDESSDFQEMMQIFRNLLKTLETKKLLLPQLTLDWVEILYFSTIDAAINLIIEDESNKEKVIEMAWISYSKAIIAPSDKTLSSENE